MAGSRPVHYLILSGLKIYKSIVEDIFIHYKFQLNMIKLFQD